MEQKAPFNLSKTEWLELLRIQRKIHKLDELSCGIDCGVYLICLEHYEENGKEIWVKNYYPNFDGRTVTQRLRCNPYELPMYRVKKICDKKGLYYYHQSDPRGAALWISDKPIDENNYNAHGVPCI